jgi:glycosyltransferase involved in cell wall biosynthesis
MTLPQGRDGSLRIMHVMLGRPNPESANGIDQVICHVARCQAEQGHRVAIASISPKPAIPLAGVDARTYPPRTAGWVPSERIRELWVGRFPLNIPGRLKADLLAWHPDVVHLHSVFVPQNIVLGRWLREHRVPYCVTIHGQLTVRRRRPWQAVYNFVAARTLLDGAAMIHAVSQEDVGRLHAYNVRRRISVVPNGVAIAELESQTEGVSTLLPPDVRGQRIFLFLGRLDVEQKGLDLLLRGFATAGLPNAALVLAGPDWDGGRVRLEREVRRLGLGRRVVFTGPVVGPEKARLLRDAGVFVHPSRWEAGLPVAVLEAAGMATPCLLTSAADPAGALTGAGAAVLVQLDADAIASALRRLAELPAGDLGAMGVRGRGIVAQDYAWPTITRAIVDGYRRALSPA